MRRGGILIDEELKKLVDGGRRGERVARPRRKPRRHFHRRDRQDRRGAGTVGPDVSRERRAARPAAHRRGLEPWQTRYGFVRTDHILFIAAGAFHVSKPSDLIPELQGRFSHPRRAAAAHREDFVSAIMTEPENALTKQYAALCAAEGATLEFTHDGIRRSPASPPRANERMENIGAGGSHRDDHPTPRTCCFDLPELVREAQIKFDADKVARPARQDRGRRGT